MRWPLTLAWVTLAAIALAPSGVGAPAIPDVLNGFGAASSFQVFAQGQALEGGLYDWTDLCGHCEIRVTLGEGQFAANSGDAFVTLLSPGVYELREYRGLFLFSQDAPHEFQVEFHGIGQIERIG